MQRPALAGMAMTLSLTTALAAMGWQARPGAPSEMTTAGEECQASFAREGSFLKGTTYRSRAAFRGVSREAVLEQATQSLAADGWRITGTDEQAGLITAVQESVDDGRESPLNTVVKQVGTDVQVEMTFSLGALMKVPDDRVRQSLCKALAEIARGLGGVPAEPAPRTVAETPPAAGQDHREEPQPRSTPVAKEAAAPPPAPQATSRKDLSANEQCRANFAKEGSFLKGTIYRSHADFPGLGRETAFEKASQSVAREGWQITQVSQEAGLITAVQQSLDGGRASTLNAAVKPQGDDTVRVEMIFSLGALMKVPDGSARESLCKMLGGIGPQ
jgi:hypothetical protein